MFYKRVLERSEREALRVNMSRLPVVAHADLAADAIDVVAEGEIDFGKGGRVGPGVKKVDA
jgi:hypothetical protein